MSEISALGSTSRWSKLPWTVAMAHLVGSGFPDCRGGGTYSTATKEDMFRNVASGPYVAIWTFKRHAQFRLFTDPVVYVLD